MLKISSKFPVIVRFNSTNCNTIKLPTLQLGDGQKIPVLGYGTWKSKPSEVGRGVYHAIEVGFRHIDCALIYRNEKQIGEALRCSFKDNLVKREDLFITSKLWSTMHKPNCVEPAIKTSLNDLGLDYLNLYLIHWPFALKEGKKLVPVNCDGTLQGPDVDVDLVDTWKAMEEVQKKGLTKSIGVSNFNKNQLERIICNATVRPMINQIEFHIYLNQYEMIEYCKSLNILVEGYSPLGSGDPGPGGANLLDDPILKKIGEKYNKTPAQVALKYSIQSGLIVLVKSVKSERIEEDFNIFDFKLNEQDMLCLQSLDKKFRYYPFKSACKLKEHPFKEAKFCKSLNRMCKITKFLPSVGPFEFIDKI